MCCLILFFCWFVSFSIIFCWLRSTPAAARRGKSKNSLLSSPHLTSHLSPLTSLLSPLLTSPLFTSRIFLGKEMNISDVQIQILFSFVDLSSFIASWLILCWDSRFCNWMSCDYLPSRLLSLSPLPSPLSLLPSLFSLLSPLSSPSFSPLHTCSWLLMISSSSSSPCLIVFSMSLCTSSISPCPLCVRHWSPACVRACVLACVRRPCVAFVRACAGDALRSCVRAHRFPCAGLETTTTEGSIIATTTSGTICFNMSTQDPLGMYSLPSPPILSPHLLWSPCTPLIPLSPCSSWMIAGNAVWLVVVGAMWGCTNPLMKRGAEGVSRIKKDNKAKQFIAENYFLLSRWQVGLSSPPFSSPLLYLISTRWHWWCSMWYPSSSTSVAQSCTTWLWETQVLSSPSPPLPPSFPSSLLALLTLN